MPRASLRRPILLVACAAVVCGLRPGRAGAEGALPPARIVADRALACTVGIRSKQDDFSTNTGTGFVISADGHILTATSVVPAAAKKIDVMLPGFVPLEATIVATDESLSVTLIKVDAKELPFLPLARTLPEIGTTAYTVGDVENAMLTNGQASFSRGVVSGVYSVPKNPEAPYAGVAIETTAAVNPGSDGGPLLDEQGRVCGVITLGVLPLRWQGTAVPMAVLRERFAPFASGAVKPHDGPLPELARAPAVDRPLRRTADELARYLVGVEVERKHPPESLPRLSWDEFRGRIADWDALDGRQKLQRFNAYLDVAKLLEVNQLLRRPAAPLSGVIVSPDGFVLTSSFNVGNDTAFVRPATGAIRTFDPAEPMPKLLGDPEGGVAPQPNAITRITVILPDGSRREATVHARHEPLGVALLKIEATDLPWLDVAGAAVSPQVGDAVGLIGHLPGERPAFTFNVGMVSAPSRLRGYQFQTDALLNYGNSGGPVFDRNGSFLGLAAAPIQPDTILGKLIGPQQLVAWRRAPNSGVGMVSRGDRIRDALEPLKEGKSFQQIPGPYLGVMANEAKAFTDDVVVGGVAPDSPAAKAGLKRGDVLVAFNGSELDSWNELTERLDACKAGDAVELTVERPAAGPRLVIAGREVETVEDLQRLKKSLEPGETFTGVLAAESTRVIPVVLGETK